MVAVKETICLNVHLSGYLIKPHPVAINHPVPSQHSSYKKVLREKELFQILMIISKQNMFLSTGSWPARTGSTQAGMLGSALPWTINDCTPLHVSWWSVLGNCGWKTSNPLYETAVIKYINEYMYIYI